ncbi:hypothetical protein NHH03_23905 [Stieleria sp. TO1_6]|uniref:AtpZ/AtpI family protein n=1 Tax=Stieleria tagensis TaxID=2956795 RepID=UPI00209B5D99|nr:AtpZ/AtpI family protein [Stieleria tagensis]MCO8124803.1 hypothetical protein [Stieleria tagensis]
MARDKHSSADVSDQSSVSAGAESNGTGASPGRDQKSTAPVWMRLTGAGMELAFITIALGWLGSLVDANQQTARPVFAALCGLVGFALGMVRFIRLAVSVSKQQRDAEQRSRAGKPDAHDHTKSI